MEILSCHSNERTLATTIKNIIYVEANVMNIYAKFQLHPPYGFMVGKGLIQKHSVKLFQNSCSNTEINANFHFSHSHYKSMETLSCHSNESTWAMTIKNIIYVEANVTNMYAKFQLHPPYGFWGEDFLIFFRKFTLYAAMATNLIQQFGQNSYES